MERLTPADERPDLTGLGLVMALGADVFMALSTLLAFMLVLTPGGAPVIKLLLFLSLAMGAVRSVYHRAAAQAVLYGLEGGAVTRIRRYLVASLLHVAVVLVTLWRLEILMSGLMLVPVLVAWPAVLLAITESPRLRRALDEPAVGDDRGFGAASHLMIVLGVSGALMTGLIIVQLARVGFVADSIWVTLTAALVALLIRSIVHVEGGWAGLRAPGSEAFRLRVGRYGTLGVVSALLAALPFLLLALRMESSTPSPFLLVGAVAWLLVVWPLTLKRLVGERLFSVLLENQRPIRRVAGDGVEALGWLAIAGGALGLAWAAGVLMGPGPLQLTRELDLGDATSNTRTLLQIATSIVQLVAGVTIALRHRLRLPMTLAYGVLGTGIAVWSIVDGTSSVDRLDWSNLGTLTPIGLMLFAAAQPLLTLLLVGRTSSGRVSPESVSR